MTYLEMEDFLLEKLEPLRAAAGLRALTTYGGEFSPDSFGQVTVVFPAVYIYLSGLRSAGRNRLDERDQGCTVMVAARNLRGEPAARRGAAGETGVYALFEGVRAHLNRLPLAGGLLRLAEERVVGYSARLGLCVGQADYRLKYRTN